MRPGASAPGPVSARPTGCHPSGQSRRCGPQGLHGWRAPDPAQWPHQPGCMLGEAGRLVPEALLCSAGPLAPHKRLNFSDVSHDSARVSWEGPPRPVRPCRVSYVSGEGGHSGQVRAGRCPGAPECPRRCWCPEPPPSPVSAVGWGKHGSATLSQPLGTPVWREREGWMQTKGPPVASPWMADRPRGLRLAGLFEGRVGEAPGDPTPAWGPTTPVCPGGGHG